MSPLTTITFDTLRERSDTALRNAEYTYETDISELEGDVQEKVWRLLQKRVDLEELEFSTTESQIGHYGAERWNSEFVRTRDIDTNPDASLEGEALRNHVWETMPNSRFKRFQEAFSHPHQWIVPAFTIGDRNYVRFTGRPNFNTMSLDPCLVSADRIPEKLAEDLDLADFEDDKGKPYRRLEKKSDLSCINALKQLWESTTPLQARSNRLLRINTDDPATNGRILYTREADNGNDSKTQRTVQFFGNSYGALRKTHHERHNYRKEIDELTSLQLEVQALNSRLNTEWKKGTPENEKEALRVEAQVLVSRARELYRSDAWEDKYKVNANELLTKIVDLKDKSGKPNVTSCLSKLVAANNRLNTRCDNIEPKSGYNEQDQIVLERTVKTHEKTMRTFRDAVVDNAPAIHGNIHLFNGKALSDAQIASQVSGVMGRLRFRPDQLNNITLEPFATYAQKLREKYEELSAAVTGRDLETAQQTIVQMHLIGKFQAVQTCFERIKQYMIDGEHLPISRIREFVSKLNTLFSTFQVYENIIVESYREPFEKIQGDLQAIEDRLHHYEQQDIDVSQRTKIYKDLKAYLETFDLEGTVRDLV